MYKPATTLPMMTFLPSLSCYRVHSLLFIAILMLTGCGLGPQVWNHDGEFDLEPFETDEIQEQLFIDAPWSDQSWGIEGASFDKKNASHAISGANFISWGNEGYLYGKEEAGFWSFVRYIQGDVWGGTYEGPVPWYVPPPLYTNNKKLTLSLDIQRDTNLFLTEDESWQMFAINVWLNAPDFPKPLVLDLIFYHDCNWPECNWGTFEDEDAYHYQTFIGETPYREWQSWTIPLHEHIQEALTTFDLSTHAQQTKLYQLEFVIELKHAEGAAIIKNFFLVYE